MARRTGRQRSRSGLAAKLIGIGLLLGVVPMVIGSSPIAAAFRPMAPFGWLAFAVGCGMLWWQLRGRPATTQSASIGRPQTEAEAGSNAIQRTQRSPHMDRAATDPPTEKVVLRVGERPIGAQTWGATIFDVIEWRRFEAVVEALFAQAGFETQAQSHGADEGIDIWLYSRNHPGAPFSVVQCKHWHGRRVGVDKVRELRGVMAAKNVTRGQFATTSVFTQDAIAFAKDNGISLLDVQGLLALIATRTEDQQDALLAVALEGEYWKPTCVNCGVKMVSRTPRKVGAAFWGCASYPKCKTTLPMRGA